MDLLRLGDHLLIMLLTKEELCTWIKHQLCLIAHYLEIIGHERVELCICREHKRCKLKIVELNHQVLLKKVVLSMLKKFQEH